MIDTIRPITICSRYFEGVCKVCDATVEMDSGPEGYDGDPIEVSGPEIHHDDCPVAARMAEERATATAAQMFAALAVMVRCQKTHDWLAENDPQALLQAKSAMLVYGYTYGSEKCRNDVVFPKS